MMTTINHLLRRDTLFKGLLVPKMKKFVCCVVVAEKMVNGGLDVLAVLSGCTKPVVVLASQWVMSVICANDLC